MRQLTSMEMIDAATQQTNENTAQKRAREQSIAIVSRMFGVAQSKFGPKEWALVEAHQRRAMSQGKSPEPQKRTFKLDPTGRNPQ